MFPELDVRWDGSAHEGYDRYKNVNKKQGYMVFTAACFNIATILLTQFVLKRMAPRKNLPRTRWRRVGYYLAHMPLAWQVVMWLAIDVAMLLVPYTNAMLTTPVYIHFKLWMSMLKRSGRVGLAMYPFIIFLSLRPNPLPDVLYLRLLPLHIWLSRLSIACIMFHSFGFLAKWIKNDGWKKGVPKLFGGLMGWGTAATTLLLLTLVLGYSRVRQRCYRLFFSLHIITAWASVPLMYMHCDPEANLYIFLSAALLVYNAVVRIVTAYNLSKSADSYDVVSEPESDLLLVRIDKCLMQKLVGLGRKDLRPHVHYPGAHLRINYALYNPKAWLFASHPYTIVSEPQSDTFDLVLKKSGRFFQKIFEKNYGNFSINTPFKALQPDHFERADYQHVSIVCGGAGIAFGIPIFKYLYAKNLAAGDKALGFDDDLEEAITVPPLVTLTWVFRHADDMFVLKETGIIDDYTPTSYTLNDKFRNANLDIYVTGGHRAVRAGPSVFKRVWNKILRRPVENHFIPLQELVEDIDVDSLPSDLDLLDSTKAAQTVAVNSGRLNVTEKLQLEFEGGAQNEQGCIVCCGPTPLMKEASRWASLNRVDFLEAE